MKENEGCCVVPTDTGKIWDDEDRELRYATLAELLERIKDCEHHDGRMMELENIVYCSGEIQLCWKLIDEGKYLEVNRYAID